LDERDSKYPEYMGCWQRCLDSLNAAPVLPTVGHEWVGANTERFVVPGIPDKTVNSPYSKDDVRYKANNMGTIEINVVFIYHPHTKDEFKDHPSFNA
jgi:hypothetical protein